MLAGMRELLVSVSSALFLLGLFAGCGDPVTETPDAGTQVQCGPSNCTGCCFNGICQPGVTMAGCGKAGQACAVCVKGQICTNTQTCGLDPESVWVVVPVSTQLGRTAGYRAWTLDGGPPDVYLQLNCPGESSPSKTYTSTGAFRSPPYSVSWFSGGECETTGRDLVTRQFKADLIQTNAPYSSPDYPTSINSLYHTFSEAEVLDGGVLTLPVPTPDAGGMESSTFRVMER